MPVRITSPSRVVPFDTTPHPPQDPADPRRTGFTRTASGADLPAPLPAQLKMPPSILPSERAAVCAVSSMSSFGLRQAGRAVEGCAARIG